jgi:hypothetical protein
MDIVARDVVGTAHVNARAASSFLETTLRHSKDVDRIRAELEKAGQLLVKALGDVELAHHMISSDWGEPTTYVGVWDREKADDMVME